MNYTITVSGSGSIKEILKSLKEVSNEIKNTDFDYLDGYEYEDPTLSVSLYETE